ncbi:lipoprotein [Vibrio cholerae]|nr:lipoprotein [Vibrio cholerae]
MTSGDYGSYQTSYRWEEGQVREIRREVAQLCV